MQIAPDQIDPDAAKVVQRLRDNDHLAYLVGGCVRDLLLGRKPKDFDVVTSATPNEIKRLFRNCRIIGRRFRLAHIFYGPKIIETSTFRANPRELEDDDAGGGEAESGDLLIRRDNVFGTPEEDARRRDFTINGLFYDTKTGQVIDHVNGMADLEARIVRTIGDPDIRFREDPIRILRAVKFAARCDLTIEPETYRRMMEHRSEIAKCAQARVSEEFYRLLRAGAAKRSMELLVETDLLEIFAPELARGLRPAPAADARPDAQLEESGATPRAPVGLPGRARPLDRAAAHPADERPHPRDAAAAAAARRARPEHARGSRRRAAHRAVHRARARAAAALAARQRARAADPPGAALPAAGGATRARSRTCAAASSTTTPCASCEIVVDAEGLEPALAVQPGANLGDGAGRRTWPRPMPRRPRRRRPSARARVDSRATAAAGVAADGAARPSRCATDGRREETSVGRARRAARARRPGPRPHRFPRPSPST